MKTPPPKTTAATPNVTAPTAATKNQKQCHYIVLNQQRPLILLTDVKISLTTMTNVSDAPPRAQYTLPAH